MRKVGRSVEEIAKIYRLWHQKEPDEVIEHDFPIEDVEVFRAGYADTILYASDKWEDDGDFYDYVHDFDSGPAVFMADGEGEKGDLRKLLCAPSVSKALELPLPVLAFVKEFIVVHDDGSKRSLRFRTPPVLCCTSDKKGLLILSEELGPIYVRGGKMFVNERGIHH